MLFLLFSMGPLMIWGPVYRSRVDPSLTRRAALLLGLANVFYMYVNQVADWRALVRIVRQRRDWTKTERNGVRNALPSSTITSVARAT